MGKKSRLKREAATTRATQPTPQPQLMVVAALPAMTHEEKLVALRKHLIEEAAYQKEYDEIQRLNNLPLGHPDNAHKLDQVFSPIERWLDNLDKTSEYDVLDRVAVIKPDWSENEFYPLHEAFHAVCDTYELIANEKGIEDRSSPLRKVGNKIHYNSPIMASEIHAARATLSWMKVITEPLTPVEFSDFSVVIQTRAAFRELKAA